MAPSGILSDESAGTGGVDLGASVRVESREGSDDNVEAFWPVGDPR